MMTFIAMRHGDKLDILLHNHESWRYTGLFFWVPLTRLWNELKIWQNISLKPKKNLEYLICISRHLHTYKTSIIVQYEGKNTKCAQFFIVI